MGSGRKLKLSVIPDAILMRAADTIHRAQRTAVAGFFRLPNNCVIELGTRVHI
jgi:CTP synthase (UTP-ammonia lyase)